MVDVLTLDNGLRLVFTPMPNARSISISIYMTAGSRYEAPEDAGLSHFVEHLCFKGTERRPRPHDVAVEIDSIGGSINAVTDRELTVYYAKVTPEYAERAMDVLADIVRHSLFREEEIERERGVILEELASIEDSPMDQVGVLLDGLLWPGQPHGRDIAGTPETVSAISSERLVGYYRRQYVANACVVAIAGAIDEQRVEHMVRETLGDWEPGEPHDWLRTTEEPRGQRVGLIAKETEQAHLSFGVRALSFRDDDRHALDVLSVVLGEGMSSRLFTRLREELGLCYDIHTFVAHLRDTGMFGLYAGVDPKQAQDAIHEIVNELRRAVLQPITPDELERAQVLLRARVQLHMEDTRAIASWYGSHVVLDLPSTTPEEAIARTDAVTREDVQRVAARLISDEQLHLAVVGPLVGEDLLTGLNVNGPATDG